MRKRLGENADEDKRDKWRGKNAIHHPALLKVKSNSLMWFRYFFFFWVPAAFPCFFFPVAQRNIPVLLICEAWSVWNYRASSSQLRRYQGETYFNSRRVKSAKSNDRSKKRKRRRKRAHCETGPESRPQELAEILRQGGILPASLILLALYVNSLLIQDTTH